MLLACTSVEASMSPPTQVPKRTITGSSSVSGETP